MRRSSDVELADNHVYVVVFADAQIASATERDIIAILSMVMSRMVTYNAVQACPIQVMSIPISSS